MSVRLSLAAALLGASCLSPLAAFAAADEQSPADLEALVVTATGKTAATSSTKTDTPLIETPQSISVITREEMDVRAVATVSDALAYSAGVQAESFGIDSRVDEISVRGFGAGGFSSSNNFVDGLRLPSGGQWTRTAFDPFGLQQVEVLKGPSSVLYGQVAPGGLINQVSKRPTGAKHGEIMLQGAGYTDLGRWQGQIAGDSSGPIDADGRFLYRAVALYRDGQTQIKETSNSRLYLAPALTWNIADATSLTLLGQYQRDRGGSTYQFLPMTGTLNKSNQRRIDVDAYLGEPDWNDFDRDQQLLAAFLQHSFTDSLKLRSNLRWTHIDTLYRVTVLSGDTVTNCGALAGCIAGQTIQRRAVQGKGKSDGWALDNQLEYKLATGALDHTLLVGGDYFDTDWKHYRDLVAAARVLPLLDFYNPVPRGSVGYAQNMSPQIYTETKSKQTGLYAQDQISVGKLRVTFGGRQDWAKDVAYNPVNRVTTVTKADAFTWRAGGVYLFDNGLAPYVSYSESFQPATGTYFDGRPFEPTTGQQYEGGLRWQPVGSRAFVTLGAYQITQQNIATPDPDPTHICGSSVCSIQTGEGRIRGLELEGRATLGLGIAVVATATKTDSEVTKTNVAAQRGNQLPQVPEEMASLFVDYRFPGGALQGVGVGGGVRYTGESFGDAANMLRIPSYNLADLFLRYDFKDGSPLDGLSLSLNARNLFDKVYVATCSATSACYYGSGRTVTARLQYRW